ncbi:hypothetical protein [Streptomyces zagrosensis]|uniref:Pycsar effector protein domain-containing protein n=1 Tax=Streptomyces zagrosensis TaxID=1042984 RepID=A0A7W9UY19_9ACTN|nr:hypothetical protein [Streptomyces zagrosensis]MBB5934349.1 hypothetical protein [Streptomyces zagrosensis]
MACGPLIDWIKHAETKAGATLAATGITGGVIYNLAKDADTPSNWLIASAALCGIAVVSAGLCAGLVPWPRLKLQEDPTSLLYFHHIARGHAASDTYASGAAASVAVDHPDWMAKDTSSPGQTAKFAQRLVKRLQRRSTYVALDDDLPLAVEAPVYPHHPSDLSHPTLAGPVYWVTPRRQAGDDDVLAE